MSTVESVKPLTKNLWAKQNQHEGDRQRLFSAVGDAIKATHVLYAGSFVDIAPSFVWPSVTYVDSDKRAKRFFDDAAGVLEIIAGHGGQAPKPSVPTVPQPVVQPVLQPDVTFVAADYSGDLGLDDESFDLLISMYAGFVSEHCTRYLRVGGSLLVNPSHGDAAMASIDSRFRLSGVIVSREGQYRVKTADPDADSLADYMTPKKPTDITVDFLHTIGRGVAYTKPAFAYLFTRVA